MRIDGGEPEGYVTHADALDVSGTTVVLCKTMADTLETHYPGWMWAIQPDERGGVLNLFSLRLSGEWGYRFKLANLQGDAKVAKQLALRGGGEILERFGVPRGTYKYADWAQAPKDIAGMARADLSDKSAGVRRYQRDAALSTAMHNGTVKLVVRDTGSRRDYALKREDV